MGALSIREGFSISTQLQTGDYDVAVKDEYGVLYSPDGKRLIDATTELMEYAIKDGTEIICDRAFYRMHYLKSIVMPDSLRAVGEESFFECSQLVHIEFSSNLRYIGRATFKGCKGLTVLTLPDSLRYATGACFSGCILLSRIVLSHDLIEIPAYMFDGCQSLRECVLSNAISQVGERAFRGCGKLEKVSFKSSYVYDDGFDPEIVYEGGIEKYAFDGCFNIKELSLPEHITWVGKCAFRDCYSLQEIRLGDNVEFIHEIAFERCKALKRLVVANEKSYLAAKPFAEYLRILRIDPIEGNGVDTFILNEPFPWRRYVYPGDHVTPVLNLLSFDVVMYFDRIEQDEIEAFNAENIVVSIFVYKEVPLILFNIGDNILTKITVDIRDLDCQEMYHWQHSEYNIVRCFLVESDKGILRGVRYLDLKCMGELRSYLLLMTKIEKNKVSQYVRETDSKFSMYEMMAMSDFSENIEP